MTRRLALTDLYDVAVPEQPALSPDGQSVVYVLRTANRDTDSDHRALWEVGTADNSEPRQLTNGPADRSPAFSPDGSSVAFLRAQDGPAQLWLLPTAGGEAIQLTQLPLGAGAPCWSPDGTRIAFSAPVDSQADGAVADRTDPPIVASRLGYKADGAGLLKTVRGQLHVVTVADQTAQQLTYLDGFAGQPTWSPDGTRLAFPAAAGPDPDLNLTSAVFTVPAEPSAEPPVLIGSDTGSVGLVSWITDDAMLTVGADDIAGHGHLLLLDTTSGATTNLSKPLDRNVMPGGPGYPGASPQLRGDDVLFCVRDAGDSHLYSVPRSGGTPQPVITGTGRTVSGMSTTDDATVAVVSTPTSYGEVVMVAAGTETVLTNHGATLAEQVELFVPQAREFSISDGSTVHGWVVRDPEITGPTPLLLDVHGGPHNAWSGGADSTHLYHQVLAARGWTILIVNPRGSDGYGEAFYRGVIGNWGTSDAPDFLEPIDALVAAGEVDPKRLAITGYSYGGYTTCYLTSRDQRFAAAVAGGVVTDLTSMAGTSDQAHFLAAVEVGGLPFADDDHFAKSSPYAHVDQVTTPTLILHGGADERCPVGQAEQWFTALREKKVPTELVLYPGGPHLFILSGPLSHRLDYNQRVIDWVERYTTADGGVPRRALRADHWQRRLSELATRHGIVGATLGILRLDPAGDASTEVVRAHHGVLNVDTGTPVVADSVFQIGSISKVWTATVAMQLVDEGKIGLDTPIVEVLPELTLADPTVQASLTLRHLLTHSSGIDGDLFTDTGRGDDCIAEYVKLLADLPMNHPLGATFSYCNSGFVVLGRLIEVLTGKTWDQAMSERLFQPLGLTKTMTLPEEAILHSAAIGHERKPDGTVTRTPQFLLPRAMGPAGLITSSVDDVLAFARMHLMGGQSADGNAVLSADSTAAMPTHQVEMPDKFTLGDSWGLGWIRFDWNGHRLFGHDGNTLGQSAFLRILPEAGIAVTLLTNGGPARDLYLDLFDEIFTELADVSMPSRFGPSDPTPDIDPAPFVGTYERAGSRLEVVQADAGLQLRISATGPMAAMHPQTQVVELLPVSDTVFAMRAPGTVAWTPVSFYQLPSGEAYVHLGVRATPKVSDEVADEMSQSPESDPAPDAPQP